MIENLNRILHPSLKIIIECDSLLIDQKIQGSQHGVTGDRIRNTTVQHQIFKIVELQYISWCQCDYHR